MEKLKRRWGISSTWQIILIIIVFGLTGSSSVFVAKPILEMMGFERMNFAADFWWGGFTYYFLRIILIFPLYQVLLVLYGWIFGQFKFFWSFEKNMLERMGFSRLMK